MGSEYQSLKEEIREVETIHRYTEGMEHAIASPQKTRTQGLEL
jgi:hypothetical protein